jgi:hypothetical protein
VAAPVVRLGETVSPAWTRTMPGTMIGTMNWHDDPTRRSDTTIGHDDLDGAGRG